MIRRFEKYDSEFLIQYLKSDFSSKGKQGKIHFLDIYCELNLRGQEIRLSDSDLYLINKEFEEIRYINGITNLEKYFKEYSSCSDIYCKTLNTYAKIRYSGIPSKNEHNNSKIISFVAIGCGAVLVGLLRKSPLLIDKYSGGNLQLKLFILLFVSSCSLGLLFYFYILPPIKSIFIFNLIN